jgi:hypothetical protein
MDVPPQEPERSGRDAAPKIDSLNPDDIRRHEEQEALRKVRALADDLEGEQTREQRLGARAFWGFLVLAAILLGVFLTVVVGGYTRPPVTELAVQKPAVGNPPAARAKQ